MMFDAATRDVAFHVMPGAQRKRCRATILMALRDIADVAADDVALFADY